MGLKGGSNSDFLRSAFGSSGKKDANDDGSSRSNSETGSKSGDSEHEPKDKEEV